MIHSKPIAAGLILVLCVTFSLPANATPFGQESVKSANLAARTSNPYELAAAAIGTPIEPSGQSTQADVIAPVSAAPVEAPPMTKAAAGNQGHMAYGVWALYTGVSLMLSESPAARLAGSVLVIITVTALGFAPLMALVGNLAGESVSDTSAPDDTGEDLSVITLAELISHLISDKEMRQEVIEEIKKDESVKNTELDNLTFLVDRSYIGDTEFTWFKGNGTGAITIMRVGSVWKQKGVRIPKEIKISDVILSLITNQNSKLEWKQTFVARFNVGKRDENRVMAEPESEGEEPVPVLVLSEKAAALEAATLNHDDPSLLQIYQELNNLTGPARIERAKNLATLGTAAFKWGMLQYFAKGVELSEDPKLLKLRQIIKAIYFWRIEGSAINEFIAVPSDIKPFVRLRKAEEYFGLLALSNNFLQVEEIAADFIEKQRFSLRKKDPENEQYPVYLTNAMVSKLNSQIKDYLPEMENQTMRVDGWAIEASRNGSYIADLFLQTMGYHLVRLLGMNELFRRGRSLQKNEFAEIRTETAKIVRKIISEDARNLNQSLIEKVSHTLTYYIYQGNDLSTETGKKNFAAWTRQLFPGTEGRAAAPVAKAATSGVDVVAGQTGYEDTQLAQGWQTKEMILNQGEAGNHLISKTEALQNRVFDAFGQIGRDLVGDKNVCVIDETGDIRAVLTGNHEKSILLADLTGIQEATKKAAILKWAAEAQRALELGPAALRVLGMDALDVWQALAREGNLVRGQFPEVYLHSRTVATGAQKEYENQWVDRLSGQTRLMQNVLNEMAVGNYRSTTGSRDVRYRKEASGHFYFTDASEDEPDRPISLANLALKLAWQALEARETVAQNDASGAGAVQVQRATEESKEVVRSGEEVVVESSAQEPADQAPQANDPESAESSHALSEQGHAAPQSGTLTDLLLLITKDEDRAAQMMKEMESETREAIETSLAAMEGPGLGDSQDDLLDEDMRLWVNPNMYHWFGVYEPENGEPLFVIKRDPKGSSDSFTDRQHWRQEDGVLTGEAGLSLFLNKLASSSHLVIEKRVPGNRWERVWALPENQELVDEKTKSRQPRSMELTDFLDWLLKKSWSESEEICELMEGADKGSWQCQVYEMSFDASAEYWFEAGDDVVPVTYDEVNGWMREGQSIDTDILSRILQNQEHIKLFKGDQLVAEIQYSPEIPDRMIYLAA